jgi:hypothetical protein
MLLLMSGATKTLRTHPSKSLGILVGPRHWGCGTANYLVSSGRRWAADNDCYQGLNRTEYIAMLQRLQGVPGCLFVVAPDVVADAHKTLIRFRMWQPVIKYFGFPVAFAAQDGLEHFNKAIPWTLFDALFIGGTTSWKLGEHAARFIAEAHSLGKWVHMGRVNSNRRIRYAQTVKCDSIDGTGYSKWSKKTLPKAIPVLETTQHALPGLLA